MHCRRRLENSPSIKNHPVEVPKTMSKDVEIELSFCGEKLDIPCVQFKAIE